MKITTSNPSTFSGIEIGKPFWHIQRAGWGVRTKGICPPHQSNAFIFWDDNSMDCCHIEHNEAVVPAKEIHIRIER